MEAPGGYYSYTTSVQYIVHMHILCILYICIFPHIHALYTHIFCADGRDLRLDFFFARSRLASAASLAT